jgi:hypothetical protein
MHPKFLKIRKLANRDGGVPGRNRSHSLASLKNKD